MTNAETPEATESAIPTFHWSEVESTDYRQYIANLRAVGCPEQVIRDIIMADVNQLFAPHAATIWKPSVQEYWQKPKNEQPNPNQLKQLMALSRDKSAILEELLGVRLNEQRMIDTVFLQLHGSEQELLFLSPEKRAAALQALDDSDLVAKEQEQVLLGGHSNAADQKLFNATLKALAKVLSPAELDEFRLRGSPAANALRNEVRYFNCTPDEFRLLVDSREHSQDKNLGNLLDRTAATEEVRKLLGDGRAEEFERVTDMFYINTRQAIEEQGAPVQNAELAWQVTRDARAAADSVAKDNSLSAEERTRQLASLQQQAEKQLNELLGAKVAFGVIRDLRVVVNAKPSP
jgi:hypothetical protein